jgi:two-component system response regulator
MHRAFDLLIVDDDPDQVELIRIVIRELGLLHRCHHAANGSIALDFLNRRSPFEDAPRPHLILMDFNMPGMEACDVLRCIKGNSHLRSIPVIMLSSSQSLKDIDACYHEHANAWIQKPGDLDGSLQVIRELDRFWSETARLID